MRILYTSCPIVVSQQLSVLFLVIQNISNADTIVISSRKFLSNRMWIVVRGNLYSSALQEIINKIGTIKKRRRNSLGDPREHNGTEENRHVHSHRDIKEFPLTFLLQILLVNTEHFPQQIPDKENYCENENVRDHLNRHVPKAAQSTQPLILDFLVLGQQQILQLPMDIFVLGFSCFDMRQPEIPSAEDLVTI